VIHSFETRVYYEDTDMAGVVYHANYLKFVERARSTWVREMGVDQNAMRSGEGLAFAVVRLEADFVKPAILDDELRVETGIGEVSPVRIRFDQTVLRAGQVLFRARVTVVVVDGTGRPRRLSPDLRALLEQAR